MKKTLVIGTKNIDKMKEIQSLLKSAKIAVKTMRDFPKCPEAVEDGRTFEANARKKARAYSLHTRSLVLADDSGLMVFVLNGKPGVYSARFAGEGCTYQDNNKKLLSLLEKKRPGQRKAKFVSVMALYDAGKPVAVVKGECHGVITDQIRGKNGFGYDPVFIPQGFKKTFSEITRQQKNSVSHRSRALAKAKKEILRYCTSC